MGSVNMKVNPDLRAAWAGIVLLLPVLALHVYDRMQQPMALWGTELALRSDGATPPAMRPATPPASTIPPPRDSTTRVVAADSTSATTGAAAADTTVQAARTGIVRRRHPPPPLLVTGPDTPRTAHRVMLLGDSQSGGLNRPLRAYCAANGHELVATFTWNSASIRNFAYADTVVQAIAAFQPTFVVFVIGLNELYARDLAKRRAAAEAFEARLAGIPHLWIGPANFMPDHGINEVYKEVAGADAYFMTRGMDLPRGGDGRHPSGEGYAIWMDSVATWMAAHPPLDLFRVRPTGGERPGRTARIALNASRFKGY
jgi:hypothetical protein